MLTWFPWMTVKRSRQIVSNMTRVWESLLKREKEKVAALEAELAHWRAHGQLRDPKTGQMVPRAKS